MKNLIVHLIFSLVFILLFAPVTFSEKIFFIAPDAGIIREVSSEKIQKTWYPDGIIPEVFHTSYITYNIAYSDPAGSGFNDPNHPNRKRCLESALNYISNIFRTSGTIDILAEISEYDGTGAIAFAGSYVFENQNSFSPCFSQLRLENGTKPAVNISEIQLTVDFGRNYYEDPDHATPANNQFDLLSVLIHEFTHGFGFLSFVGPDGRTQITTNGKYLYTVFDKFIYKGNLALFSGSPPTFQGVPSDMTSNQLVFKSTFVQNYFGNNGLAIYSRDSFLDGTSLNHWDPNRTGITNAIMNPSYTVGSTIREYSLADLCALKSIGYSNIQLPDEEGIYEGNTEGEGISEGNPEGTTEGNLEGTQEGLREGNIIEGQIQEGAHLEGFYEGYSEGTEEPQDKVCGCAKNQSIKKFILDLILLGMVLLLISQNKYKVGKE